MFCPKCGVKLPDNAQFCANCGAKLKAPTAQPTQPVQPEQPVQPTQPVQPVQPVQQERPPKSAPQPKKPKKKKGILRIVALVVVCSLVAGLAGFVAGYIVRGSSEEKNAQTNSNQNSGETVGGFTFLENVTVLPDTSSWEEDGDYLIVPDDEKTPEKGDIIVFGTQKAIKVESVKTRNGKTTITYSNPELYEFLDYVDLEGEAQLDFSNFVPAEGVTLNSAERSAMQPRGGVDDWFDVDDTETAGGNWPGLKAKVDLGHNVELEVTLDIAIPTVSYKFDVDFDFNPFNDEPGVNVKNAYVQLTEDIKVNITLKASDDNVLVDDLVYPDYIELGSIPVIGVDGVGIVLEIDLVLTPEGVFELEFNVFGSLGVQVLNNEPKNLTDLQTSVSVGVAGDIKIGPQVRLLAEIFGSDLLSFSAEAGIKVGGSVNWRSTGVVCMDAGVTAYAEINAFEECLIDDWLDIAAVFTIWDDDNTPIDFTGHWENLVRVEECSYNSGTIQGTVASADDRTDYIENASITILNHENLSHQKTVYSDRNGAYTAVVPGNTYLVQISADGYIPFESLETVGDGQIIYLETYLLVEGSEDSGETGVIGGYVSNSVDGFGVPDAKLTVRQGWNMTSGAIILSGRADSAGYYTMELPLGNYTISIECEGYVANHINVAVTRNGNMNCNAVVTPDSTGTVDLGEMRIVLTWVGEPSDLDSHLRYDSGDGYEQYHIYYAQMNSYDSNYDCQAYLDVDDTSYYGPETITVYNMSTNGIYSFYVHDYTNRNYSNSTVLANSGAKIQVYMGETLVAQYYVPTSGVGNVWHVFDFNAGTGRIVGVNTFETESTPSAVGSR